MDRRPNLSPFLEPFHNWNASIFYDTSRLYPIDLGYNNNVSWSIMIMMYNRGGTSCAE